MHTVAPDGLAEGLRDLLTRHADVEVYRLRALEESIEVQIEKGELAVVQALKAGADEALMLDPTGAVATCNATNFFVVRRGEVLTSTGHYSLGGITRRMIIELCKTSNIPVSERPFSLTDVYGADEAFVTGTFGGITPVVEVDGRTIGAGERGELTARLTDLYAEAISEATVG